MLSVYYIQDLFSDNIQKIAMKEKANKLHKESGFGGLNMANIHYRIRFKAIILPLGLLHHELALIQESVMNTPVKRNPPPHPPTHPRKKPPVKT